MGGTKKGIHHFLKWPPSATMPGELGYSQGFVRIAELFIKHVLVLLYLGIIYFLRYSQNFRKFISYLIL